MDVSGATRVEARLQHDLRGRRRLRPHAPSLVTFVAVALSAIVGVGRSTAQPRPKPLSEEAAQRSTMPLPAELRQGVDTIPASAARSRRHPLEFPPYAVTRLSRKAPNAEELKSASLYRWANAIETADHYSFVLKEETKETWKADCLSGQTTTTSDEQAAQSGIMAAASERTIVQCVFSIQGRDPWTLEFEGAMSSNFLLGEARNVTGGRLVDGERTFIVRPSFRPDSFVFTGPGALGYVIGSRERPLAAVAIVPPGKLIVAKTVDANERSLFAAAAAAMMLQSDAGD